jgi:Ca2+-binding RTX toxin-like protein
VSTSGHDGHGVIGSSGLTTSYGGLVIMHPIVHVPRKTSGVKAGRHSARALVAALGILALLVAQLVIAAPVAAAAFTGGFSPTIIGGLADLNGDGVVNGSDDANAFYGDTSIIDGKLDCDAWGPIANDGGVGNGTIDASDDCALVGYDGTSDGVTIWVVNGVFQVANGPLPTVFNAGDPDNPDIGDSDFAWSTIDGRVDANGNETIDGEDCSIGLAGADILGNDGTNPCGFATPPNTANNGLVDLNQDQDITSADTCTDGCFFGHDVLLGKVQALAGPEPPTCPGFASDPRNQVVGTAGDDVLTGTAGADIICGLGGNDTLRGLRGADLLRGGAGHDLVVGGRGSDTLRGGSGTDILRGRRGPDTLRGGTGSDRLNGGLGIDSCRGGPGADTILNCE